ncbi:MAG: M81 family metallopeptidase, partial [Anaerolineaceae bacterium]|nr:M81 family metallopeptidase [Anaerolineaceae bacterium]
PLSQETFDTVMTMILESLQANGPYDGLFLDLHGAMVYENLQDGEAEILRRVREIVGEIPIVTSFDLHGNIDPACFDLATAMVGYRTYPHVDGFENGERCAQLLLHIMQGNPIFGAFRQSPFLMPSTTQATTKDPAKSLYAFLEEGDQLEGVLSSTFMEGFPPCDLPHTGPSIFAYGVTQVAADQAVERLYQYILDREDQFICDLFPWDEAARKAVELAKSTQAPIILADIQDNAGGGSPSDSTWLLGSLVKYGAQKTVLGLIHDPEAAAAAFEAGEGAEIALSVGGKSLAGHHPFHARFKVVKLHDGDFLGTGPMVKDRKLNLGKMAQLLVDDVRVIVATERMQALDQSLFRVVGVEPKEMKILALKSANHYRADFGPIASQIINVESPSAIIEDPSKIPYTNLREGVRLKGLGPVYHRPD